MLSQDFSKSIQVDAAGACLIDPTEVRVIAANKQLRRWIRAQSDSISMEQLFSLLPQLNVAFEALSAEGSKTGKNEISWRTDLMRNGELSTQATAHLCSMVSGQNTWYLLLVRLDEQPSKLESYTDVVTGLPDRRVLEYWRQQWGRRKPGEPCPHALLFLDLNDFKQINDQHGHACGDRILAMLAQRWQKSLRSDDLVVRYGGDEFVILLSGVQSAEEAIPVMQRLKSCAQAPLQIEENAFSVSVSIGLALAENIEVPLNELLENADRDMYSQKHRSSQHKSQT